MNRRSPFTDPVAVEAWDARFRWREAGRLRDLTVEATWTRVAAAVAAAEGPDAGTWAGRFADAFADWRLLPGEHVLQFAGTGPAIHGQDAPAAVLNAAAFVQAPSSARARFDTDGFAAAAELATRLLDDVLLQQPGRGEAAALRIGVIGYADALHLLGLGYDSDRAREQALAMAHALAEGCLTASIGLAAERGAALVDDRAMLGRCLRRDARPGLVSDLRRWGVRHPDLTAIDPHPWLALLANNVADALDPLAGPDHAYLIETPEGARIIRSSGVALSQPRRHETGPANAPDTIASIAPAAHLKLRAALQPWIDAPIDYPIAVAHGRFGPGAEDQARQLAHELGLPAPTWRELDVDCTAIRYPDGPASFAAAAPAAPVSA